MYQAQTGVQCPDLGLMFTLLLHFYTQSAILFHYAPSTQDAHVWFSAKTNLKMICGSSYQHPMFHMFLTCAPQSASPSRGTSSLGSPALSSPAPFAPPRSAAAPLPPSSSPPPSSAPLRAGEK